MTDLASTFLQTFLLIGTNALILNFAANRAGYSSGEIAAFWFGFGILVGKLGLHGHAFGDFEAVGTALGGISVLALLWFVWFRNSKGQIDV